MDPVRRRTRTSSATSCRRFSAGPTSASSRGGADESSPSVARTRPPRRRVRRQRSEAAHRREQGGRRAREPHPERPPLRRACRRAGRRRRRPRQGRSGRRPPQDGLRAVRDGRRDERRAPGPRPVHAPPLHDDAALSQRGLHPAHDQEQRGHDLPDARSSRSSRRTSSATRRRSYDFPPAIVVAGDGSDAKTLGRAVWPPLRSRLADQLVRPERRRPGLPVRVERHAAARAVVSRVADAPRRRPPGTRVAHCSSLPACVAVGSQPQTRRSGRRRRRFAQPARACARSRRVGEPASVGRRAARGARSARRRAWRGRRRASAPTTSGSRAGRLRRRRRRR